MMSSEGTLVTSLDYVMMSSSIGNATMERLEKGNCSYCKEQLPGGDKTHRI